MRYSLVTLAFFAATGAGQEPKALSPAARMELPNVNGRIDHLSADVKGGRLFVSALGNGSIEALDVRSGKHLRSITGVAEPQGVYYEPAANRLFAACAKDGTVKIYDANSFTLLETVKYSGDADNLRYDGRRDRVIVGYGDGALGFLNADGKKLGGLSLDAHPESFQLESTGTRVFVNVPDRREIQVGDLAANKLIAKWSVTSASQNYPMALDEAGHRLLVGCRSPARLLAIDTDTGKQTASVEIVGDTDDLFYDSARKRVYVIGGGGFVDVLAQKGPDQYARMERHATAAGARTGLFVPAWNKLFVAAPHRGERRAEILVFEIH